jgi:hypothetical protein
MRGAVVDRRNAVAPRKKYANAVRQWLGPVRVVDATVDSHTWRCEYSSWRREYDSLFYLHGISKEKEPRRVGKGLLKDGYVAGGRGLEFEKDACFLGIIRTLHKRNRVPENLRCG